MKVLVTFALETEFAPWRSIREFRSDNWGGIRSFVAEIDGAEVGVVLTGVGPKQAAFAASRALGAERDSLKFCISSGLAGALRSEYSIGQIVAARSVVSGRPQDGPSERVLLSSAPLISFAENLGASVCGGFYTAGHVLLQAEEKRHLSHSADAVEMESFEVLREASACAIPAVAIRAISDLADEALPLDLNRVLDNRGQVSLPRVISQLARHPASLPGLVRLGQRSKRAAQLLARFLDRYIAFVVESTKNLEAKAEAAVR